ncbi:nuclear transport factor 2 family protein [Pedobacter mucosus]|uniref:nuclear transport factor 2 family protein n=1 Tax=Pedobacter mucosus TaxID=2895286 RepID=UPI001EE43CAF|nr:nuclear transport factor 2 family protein [Pedobacter mucosus]UKT65040.1 nuclear transport factor 2 family protein [Pedobacter mucosus]
MSLIYKKILRKANAALSAGDYKRFLSFCSDESVWTFVGRKTLRGKAAINEFMKTAYPEPPEFTVDQVISDGEFLTAAGKINIKGEDGSRKYYFYCNIWRFQEGQIYGLKAFII